jgi:hypothetical protein
MDPGSPLRASPCEDVRDFMVGFRAAFPDLNFWGTANLITPTSSYASYVIVRRLLLG